MVAYLVSGTFLSLSYWDFYWTLLVGIGAAWGLARSSSAVAAAPARPGGWQAVPVGGWRTA
jgi:hypothetical protein